MSGAGGFAPTIGLEVHVQLATATKFFCACPAKFGATPNNNVCPVCLGLPGSLPVANRRAIELALRMAVATGGRIRPLSRFARKNYFYPDLPRGYQISQYDEPLADGGAVEFESGGDARRVALVRIHVEDDAGKNFHLEGRPVSLVDLNRAGTPLIEVVSQPELRSPEEAGDYLRAVRQLVRFLAVSDGNMEEGSLRCDANVSVRPPGAAALGTKVEIKNMNSFRNVERALAHEIARQSDALARGEKIAQETRLWDANRGVTEPMRSKEEAHDYRYFPDPDLPPLVISDEWIAAVRAAMPELPRARRRRLETEHGLSPYDAGVLTSERELAAYYEAVVAADSGGEGFTPEPPGGSGASEERSARSARAPDGPPKATEAKRAANFVMTEVLARVADARDVATASVGPQALADLLRLLGDGTISGRVAKDVFAKMWASGRGAREIVEAEGLLAVRDAGAIDQACRAAVEAHPKEAAAYRAGKTKVFGFFVGQVMKATSGKADPALVNEALKKLLA